ncbi:hypothetical protein [Clostridium botulinum]|uniref:hypothetical protein n=1 Tax=Clostridium botulinum TaxID=1491 RepID=UPI0007744440|nr:hypothetical protein [Clostridium botulinum]NFL39291.1 hypothetical protein [Clostridium botulinum]NFL65831.1 hypothetical protein [Clostridium botulinum]
MEKEELFNRLSKDFIMAVESYRKAEYEQDMDMPYFLSCEEEKEEKYNEDERARRNTINTSKDYINLTRREYWQDILRAKIEVIGSIGGFEYMQEFAKYLRDIDKDELLLESAFVYFADGICGWCR